MKLSEYIAKLQEIEKEHGGDLDVECERFNGSRGPARIPQRSHKLIRTSRESMDRFWDSGNPSHSGRQGEKVVRV